MHVSNNTTKPLIRSGEKEPENISEGVRMDMTSAILLFDVNTFRIDTVKKSKKPVEKTKNTKPMNTIIPPIMKEELMKVKTENSL
jgi:hypothetical protein